MWSQVKLTVPYQHTILAIMNQFKARAKPNNHKLDTRTAGKEHKLQ